MHAANADAFWTLSPGHGEIRSQPLPPRDEDALLIRSHFSAVSRGTESLVFQGKVPESEYTRMRAPFQEGDFPGPVKYGYANVGVVEAGPAAWRGRDVSCLYPHQTRYVVPIEAVMPLPDDLPAARAILGANMETAINALWDAAPRIGDRITVIGAGVVGGLVAWLCRQIAGVRVQLALCGSSGGVADAAPGGGGAQRGVEAQLDLELGRPLALGVETIDGLLGGKPVRLPRFDKALDDRTTEWFPVEGPVDVILFEGWCLGVGPVEPDDEAS